MPIPKPKLLRGVKLVARRAFRYGGKNYRQGEEFPYHRESISWRKVTQLYENGRLLPALDEEGNVELKPNKGRVGTPHPMEPESPSPKKPSVELDHLGGGWYNVKVNGEVVEKTQIARDKLEGFTENYEVK